VLAALGAASALADPPNYPRHLAPAQTGLAHEPEIVSGISAPVVAAQPARVPEIVGGFEQPVSATQPVSLVRPDARGFSWSDAGIGAAIAFVAVLVTAGCALAIRRRASLAH
jgi:hypothetical protein